MINVMIVGATTSVTIQAALYLVLIYAVIQWLKEVWSDDEA